VSVQDELETVSWDVSEEPHITLDKDHCETCEDKPCLHLCPAECFDYQEDQQGNIYFAYEPCVECGACMVFCRNDPDKGAVSWSKAEGGKGVEFDFG
jgi:ferredoxin like protein